MLLRLSIKGHVSLFQQVTLACRTMEVVPSYALPFLMLIWPHVHVQQEALDLMERHAKVCQCNPT